MRKLPLHNASFEYLNNGFAEWLDILGYNEGTVYAMPNNLREFLHYLEQQQVKTIAALEQKHIKKYYEHIQQRPNQLKGGGLSEKYILMLMQAVEKFLEYLHHRGLENLPSLGVRLPTPTRKKPTILTPDEIKMLFEATNHQTDFIKQEALNARDRVMLVVYYSCGLRRNEGVHLKVEDINLNSNVLHVRKGKNYKERFVPFNKTNAQYLQEYIYDYRHLLCSNNTGSNLFINVNGKEMIGNSLYNRLLDIQRRTDDHILLGKNIGTHTLRHSIATHLLRAGMELEKVKRFLGHASLSSTEIYTHLIEEEDKTI